MSTIHALLRVPIMSNGKLNTALVFSLKHNFARSNQSTPKIGYSTIWSFHNRSLILNPLFYTDKPLRYLFPQSKRRPD
ncbi:MAG: hypothetical protein CMJ47_02805 [Planctomyces sp.]|nr:hypothetical protein [Planctomyces sp.]